MLAREFIPSRIYENFAGYTAWQQHAIAARETLCDFIARPTNSGKSLPVDARIYGALKPYLKAYFSGKCAYSESQFDAVSFGDVEHYRPKRKVEECEDHPGYYWLAYSEQNLLPSCQLCNQGEGKRNRFPIQGAYARSPNEDLSQEQPLLLNPYDPACALGHLEYEFNVFRGELWPTGRVRGVTRLGVESVRVYNLNRPALVKRRRTNQHTALTALKFALVRGMFDKVYKNQFSPQKEHASAVRAACTRWKENHMAPQA